tara:strand:+ start:301 stop:543 length:243 start_codon:yes stop_codon:yes gene_type:complete
MLSDKYMKLLGYITFAGVVLYVINKLLFLNNNIMLWALNSDIKEGMVVDNNLTKKEKNKLMKKIKRKKIKESLMKVIDII